MKALIMFHANNTSLIMGLYIIRSSTMNMPLFNDLSDNKLA